MRGRTTLMMMLATLLLTTACQLSDRQQIGVMKFVASSITGALDTRPAQQVKAATKASHPCTQTAFKVTPAMMPHAVQHMHSRVRRIMTRVIHFEVFTAVRTCPQVKQSTVRS